MNALAGKRFGFSGAGVIAEVFIRRLLKSGLARPEDILAYDTKGPLLERLACTFSVRAVQSDSEVVAGSDLVLLAVPPLAAVPVLREVAASLRANHMVLSLAAAVPTELMEQAIGKPVPVVRLIPNTASWIGEGMNPFCFGRQVSPAAAEEVRELLKEFGEAKEIPGEQMAIATSLTAVGPTYVFPVIAALADAASRTICLHTLPCPRPARSSSGQPSSSRRRSAAPTAFPG
jgi:pyrroline-5-carboxylate reductase